MRIIGKSLYGSQNCHLDGSNSDKDYKVFFAPEFIDLYRGKEKPSLPIGYDADHFSAMDIRKLNSLLHKGNINAIEYIFSSELDVNDEFMPYFRLAREAFANGYAFHVWNGFFSSMKGCVCSSITRYNNNDENRRKAAGRGAWYVALTSAILKNNYRLSASMWEAPSIYKFARELRFDEDYTCCYEWEDWDKMFQYIEVLAANSQCYTSSLILHDYDNQMNLLLQNIIGDAIKAELERR